MGDQAKKLDNSVVISTVRRLFRPAVRFALRNGLKVQDLIELCKRELLQAVEENIAKAGKKKTLSNICIQTGLHRKDVKRLSEDSEQDYVKDDYATKIIGLWQGSPKYRDTSGKEKLLSFGSADSEFNQLCLEVTKDFNPSSLLTELVRLDAVEIIENTVRLKSDVLYLDDDVARGFELLGYDCSDLISAVESNLLIQPIQPHLHRRTEYDNIDSEHLPEISKWIYQQGISFHKKLRAYLSNYDSDLNPDTLPHKGERSRIVVGSFSFSETEKKDKS